ncbi:MAG: tyrosine-type recombinase/integrase, partial [Eubacterium sp.]|nr:tyrosine-type recombinase/integrase [Eubacterium sp.]
GRTKHGYRHMPLVDDSISIIMKIYELNSDSQYLFAKNNKRLYKDTFNEHLKKYCEDVGINSKSSHKIRFYYASKLYNDGAKVTNIKRLLGHSKLETTLHYIQSVVDNEEADEEVRNILNKSANRLQTIIQ